MPLRRIDFPVLARGMDREAPRGTLNPQAAEGPLWRELQNLVPHEGELRRREGTAALSGGAPTFLDDEAQYVAGLFEVAANAVGTTRWLLVTSRELYIGSAGSWTNITPRYETGTVSVTNGTTGVTGVGTDWATRFISASAKNQIELPEGSGDWYEIATVGSNTSITLASNYTGTTLAGSVYSIRRTFDMTIYTPKSFVGAVSMVGDLYVCGIVSHGDVIGAGTALADGGVLKITGGANLLKTSFDPATDVEYLLSGVSEVAPGIDSLGYNLIPVGFGALPDGRLVVMSVWADRPGSTAGVERLHYSSHLNLAVWTTSPGGFTDVVGPQGAATAMTTSGHGVSVHFTDGIVVGDLTGAQDPPLRFRKSDAAIGAAGSRAVVTIPGARSIPPGEFFIGSDGGAYLFNGGDALPIEWASAKADFAANGLTKEELADGFCRLDTFRHYVAFHYDGNKEARFYYDSPVYLRCDYPFDLTAAMTPLQNGGDMERHDTAGYLGTARFNGATPTNLIYELRDDTTSDALPDVETTAGMRATTDLLTPETNRRWAISHIEVYALGVSAGTETLKLEVIRDGTAESLTASLTVTTTNEAVAVFFPAANSARNVQLRVGSNDGKAFRFRLTRMTVWLADVGEARAA